MKVVIVSQLALYKEFLYDAIAPYIGEHEIYILNERKPISDILEYDVGISFMYQYKVQKSELSKATWINFHPAPLPQYKGRNLCYHAIMNGEKEFGATVHYMDENFDTGDIIDVFRFLIEPHWTAEDLHNKTIDMSKRLFREFLSFVLAGERFERKPNIGGTYYKKEKIDDVRVKTGTIFGKWVRATYFPPYYPRIDIGGVIYKIVRDE